jgi:hypothetical protein
MQPKDSLHAGTCRATMNADSIELSAHLNQRSPGPALLLRSRAFSMNSCELTAKLAPRPSRFQALWH